MDLKFMYSAEYKSMRQNLDYVFDDTHLKDKDALRIIMLQRGFRKDKDGNRKQPTTQQLEIAWEYIKHKSVKSEYKEGRILEKQKPVNYVWIKAYSYRKNNKLINVKHYRRKKRNV